MYEDFVPERDRTTAYQERRVGTDMSLSLEQANNYINNIENKEVAASHAVFLLYL